MGEEVKTPDSVSDGEHVAAAKVDVPPDGGYGWVCVACCFLINAHTWGINSSYGSYSLPPSLFYSANPLTFR